MKEGWSYENPKNLKSNDKMKTYVRMLFGKRKINVTSIPTYHMVLPNDPRHEKFCLWHIPTTKAQISLRIHAVW